MPKVTIDNRSIDVAEGTSLLQAAEALGIAIPTLCHLKGFAADPMCYVCVVQIDGQRHLSPACATAAVDGMVVHTATDDVLAARRTALELMLSDHTGDCVGPCTLGCPAHVDNADFIRHLARGNVREALAVIKRKIAFPASLGRICPRFCEKACRRQDLDQSVAICWLHRYAAERDLESGDGYVPERAPSTGKRVAIVGAGPAGLSAAFYLQQFGHATTLLEERDEPGGLFRWALTEWRLPRRVLDGEIDAVRRLGAEIRTRVRLGRDVSLNELRRDYDAVLVATGAEVKGGTVGEYLEGSHTVTGGEVDLTFVKSLGLAVGPRGVKVDRGTQSTNLPGVFAAGNVASGPNYGVHAVAAGRRAAVAIDQFARGLAVAGEPKHVHVVMRSLNDEEKAQFHADAEPAARCELGEEGGDAWARGLEDSQARTEARRCLDCDCLKRRDCRLREFAEGAGASPSRFHGDRRGFARDTSHAEIVYESGKCIQCGRCLRLAEAAREELGLTLIGRGFVVRTSAPLAGRMAEALRRTARQCAEACPTGAISLKRT